MIGLHCAQVMDEAFPKFHIIYWNSYLPTRSTKEYPLIISDQYQIMKSLRQSYPRNVTVKDLLGWIANIFFMEKEYLL